MVAGFSITLLLTTTDRLFAWGANESGQLGLGDNANRTALTPVPLALAPGEHIAQVVAGAAHNLLWTTADRLFAWGANGQGQLGLRDDRIRMAPTPIPLALLPGEHIAQVVAQGHQTLLWTTTDRPFACGINPRRQRNGLTLVMLPLLPGERIAQTAVSGGHTITTTGRLLTFLFDNQKNHFCYTGSQPHYTSSSYSSPLTAIQPTINENTTLLHHRITGSRPTTGFKRVFFG